MLGEQLGHETVSYTHLKRVGWHPRATFHALIVPQVYRVTPLSDILYHYRSSRVLPDTLGVQMCIRDRSCNPPVIRPSPKATFRPHVAPRHCRAAPSLSLIHILYDKAAAVCEKIISEYPLHTKSAGKYSAWQELFMADNHLWTANTTYNGDEIIFAVEQMAVTTPSGSVMSCE